MKSSENFKRTILNYLEQRTANDCLFAVSYRKPNKNIDGCITYILNEVQKSGCNGFADDEIYSMAVHYYDEDSIDSGKPLNCRIAVNHIVELTAEEKEQARKDAVQQIHNETYAKLKQPQKKTVTNQTAIIQTTLF